MYIMYSVALYGAECEYRDWATKKCDESNKHTDKRDHVTA